MNNISKGIIVKDGNIDNKKYRRNGSCNRFVTIKQKLGRIGNNLFQVAAVFGVAYDNDFIPVIPPSDSLLQYFDLPNVFKINTDDMTKCSAPYSGIYYPCCFNRSEVKTVYIEGHVHSWKYFANAEHVIRTLFKIKHRYTIEAESFLTQFAKPGFKRICAHVRICDILIKKRQA